MKKLDFFFQQYKQHYTKKMGNKSFGKAKQVTGNNKGFKKTNDRFKSLKPTPLVNNSKFKKKQNKLKLEEINQDFKNNNDKLEDVHQLMKTYDHQKKNNITNDNIVAKTSLPSAENIQKMSEIDLKVKKQSKELKEKAEKELNEQLDFISGFKL